MANKSSTQIEDEVLELGKLSMRISPEASADLQKAAPTTWIDGFLIGARHALMWATARTEMDPPSDIAVQDEERRLSGQ